MRWKGNISMNIRCKVKIPEGNNKFMLNFKKEWAEIMMAADQSIYLQSGQEIQRIC